MSGAGRQAGTMGELITSTRWVDAAVSCGDVTRMFDEDTGVDAFAVLDGPRIALVTRAGLRLRLAQPDAQARLEGRAIRELAEEPFVCEAQDAPTTVVGQAMARPSERAYDDIVIVEDGRYRGLVSMRSLLTHHKDLVLASTLAMSRLDERARSLEDQLRQAQKMEAVGRLAGGVAHDFNNLLFIITAYAEQILRRPDEKDRLAARVEAILKAADQAAAVTRQLLAFSRKQIIQPRVVDLNALIHDIGKLLGRLIGEDVRLHTTPGAGLGRVKVDPGQIEQLLMNLAVNARDAMPSGGELHIETRNVDVDGELAARHVGLQPGPHVAMVVADTGIGMGDAVLPHVFEPFFTTKSSGKGTGLGLATVYGIVTQSGGYVTVDSRPGHGSTFTIYLPRIEEPLAAAAPQRPEPSRAVAGETVLVVEDEPGVRTMVRDMLVEHGYTVLDAPTPDEALWLARAHPGPIDLVVTDVVMPGMSGRQLVGRMTALRPSVKTLYISGYTDDAMAEHGVLGADVDLLEKPFTAETLVRRLREILDAPPGSAAASPEHA